MGQYESSSMSQYDPPARIRPNPPRNTPVAIPHENWNREDFEWSQNVQSVLYSSYGYRTFREKQLEIINATLAKRDVFVLMPTGGGKSLCFQIPAFINKGITVVVCPLIALIQDQVDSLQSLGVQADYIGSGQLEDRESEIFRGENKVKTEV
jgi:superfamily II DNA helicase RecQ